MTNNGVTSLRTCALCEKARRHIIPSGQSIESNVHIHWQSASVRELDEGRQANLGFVQIQHQDHRFLMHFGSSQ